jgi:hypothetical protein
VSDQYGVKDAACPISTKGGGWAGGGGARGGGGVHAYAVGWPAGTRGRLRAPLSKATLAELALQPRRARLRRRERRAQRPRLCARPPQLLPLLRRRGRPQRRLRLPRNRLLRPRAKKSVTRLGAGLPWRRGARARAQHGDLVGALRGLARARDPGQAARRGKKSVGHARKRSAPRGPRTAEDPSTALHDSPRQPPAGRVPRQAPQAGFVKQAGFLKKQYGVRDAACPISSG